MTVFSPVFGIAPELTPDLVRNYRDPDGTVDTDPESCCAPLGVAASARRSGGAVAAGVVAGSVRFPTFRSVSASFLKRSRV
jgi:hypothetical protein